MATTRLLPIGIGGQPAGSFAGKAEAAVPVSRLAQIGIGWRRYAEGAFAGKAAATPEAAVTTQTLFMKDLGRFMNP